ncbi:exonuclease VII small subunit [Paenibacillus sp. SORGH_AS306]|nr:exonuclease VII small subunit [Paenibacillus sp. SORGH_AS_0306]MDR6111033.1 exonuclease VII small subunit [Paenibacillus sp. SORGH_AS_0338]
MEKATKLWDRAVDYYADFDENLDRLQKRVKDWKNYQSTN